MEPLRGLLIIPSVLAVGVADLIGRCLRRETLDERLQREHGDRYVCKMTPDMLPKEPS